jgi:tRNA (guanine-N7-)-methyltransferase
MERCSDRSLASLLAIFTPGTALPLRDYLLTLLIGITDHNLLTLLRFRERSYNWQSWGMERPTIRSYQLRGSRMTGAQRSALDNYSERFLITPEDSFSPNKYFPDHQKVIVEIGSGMGEATAEIARSFPELGFIAVEVHQPGIGALMLKAVEYELNNIKMVNEDCHLILDLIEDGSVDGFHIFFPDPWPKTKHQKRRIINENFVEVLAKKVNTGGFVKIATDWMEYAIQIEAIFGANKSFSGGITPRPQWRPLTKFEEQGISKEHEVRDFLYIRS